MADSLSDPKVEDVLSSVRRLVSGEIPRKERAPLPKGPGALVLTNAHRVAKDPLSRKSSRTLEDRIAELEAAVDDGSDEFEPDGSEDQAQNIPDRIVYTRPPTSEEDANMRGSTLRLSQLALIQNGPVNDTDDDVIDNSAVPFRHEVKTKEAVAEKANGLIDDTGVSDKGADNASSDTAPTAGEPASKANDIVEAPMAVDVPTMPPRRADVSIFSNPDDFVDRIEARIDRGEDHASDVSIGHNSAPGSGDTRGKTEENILRDDVFQDAAEKPETEADFDAALSEAVEASVTSAVMEELANADLSDDKNAGDTLILPQDAPVVEMEDLDLKAAGMTEFAPAQEPYVLGSEEQVQEPSWADATPTDGSVEETAGGQTEDGNKGPDTILLDDDALKAQVALLIRKELQGELGERITRNVRKLVRREIKHVLESRDII